MLKFNLSMENFERLGTGYVARKKLKYGSKIDRLSLDIWRMIDSLDNQKVEFR
jgi:hypothetical protein